MPGREPAGIADTMPSRALRVSCRGYCRHDCNEAARRLMDLSLSRPPTPGEAEMIRMCP